MALLKAEFDCEVLTPMFLSGVDQNTCELRAASLRGVLRYWYRALLGGQGVTDLRELKRRETAVFGSTDAASPVNVRVTPVQFAPDQLGNPERLEDWNGGGKYGTPTRYLWYSTRLGDNHRLFVQPGTHFRVSFSTVLRRGDDAAQRRHAFEEALRAFWLVAHLGSLGTRARRAAGSFEARLVDRRGDFACPDFRVNTGNGFDDYLRNGLTRIVGTSPEVQRPEFSALHSQYAKVWRASADADSWSDAVWKIGSDLREFRLRRGVDHEDQTQRGLDYHTMKQHLMDGQMPPTVERASFGLPITFGFKGVHGKATVRPVDSDRRASPLWIRIVRLERGWYDAVLTHFDSRFLPGRGEMRMQKGHGQMPAPAQSLVPLFVQHKLPDAAPLFG